MLVAFLTGAVCGMAGVVIVSMIAISLPYPGEDDMEQYRMGDVVTLKGSGRQIIVLKVFPQETGVWALYRNPIGDIDARGYNKISLGAITGHMDLGEIEQTLKDNG